MGSILTWNLSGDRKVQEALKKGGTRLRFELGKALAAVTREALAAARAGAPTQRTREGIRAYGYGFESNWNSGGSGSGMPREMINAVEDTLKINDRSGLATVITNQYYLGRFREQGFDGTVSVRAHARRAPGRKTWARPRYISKMLRSFDESYGSDRRGRAKARQMAKGYGYSERRIKLMFNRKGGQVWVAFKAGRRQRITRVPFMTNAYERVSGRFTQLMTEAAARGVAGES